MKSSVKENRRLTPHRIDQFFAPLLLFSDTFFFVHLNYAIDNNKPKLICSNLHTLFFDVPLSLTLDTINLFICMHIHEQFRNSIAKLNTS